MIKKHIVLVYLFVSATYAQQIHQESFEGTTGYTTSNLFASSSSDHFNRLLATTWNAQGNWGSSVTNFHNLYYVGVEDHDGIGYVGEQWVKLDPVNISGAANLEVKIRLAASSLTATRYESDDYFIVEYRLNGSGVYTKIGEFRGVGAGNSFFHDVNLNGVTGTGDDVQMTGTMADITYNLDSRAGSTVTGNTIEVRVRFSSQGSHEEMAFDDIRINGTSVSCNITDLVAGTQSACDPGANTYTQNVRVTYSNEPGSGTLDVNGQPFAIGVSPQTVTLTGLISDGSPVNVVASFSADAACTFSSTSLFTAPANCEPPCNISTISAGTQFPCSGSTNKYAQEVIVSYTNSPTSGTLDINGQSFAITTSPQTVMLVGLESDGLAVNVIAEFSAEGACTLTTNNVFSAPTSCNTACSSSLIGSEGFEGADYTGYSTSILFFNDGTDAFDRGGDANFNFESAVIGEEGLNYIGIEDVAGEQWLELDAINIVGAFGIQVKLKMAAISTMVTRYEASDYVIVEYQLDGAGAYTKLGEFRGVGAGSLFFHDVNLDGVTGTGDDVQMTGVMTDITFDLDARAGYGITGSTVKLRVRFSLPDSQEEVAFDDIRVEAAMLDDTSFSYSTLEFCQNGTNPSPNITGVAGGTFSAAAGLIIDTSTGIINLSASTPSIYTVTYTTGGACSNSSNVSVTVKDSNHIDCSTAGVSDNSELHDNIILYPNPVSDGYIIINNKTNKILTKVDIHDMLGKTINSYKLNSRLNSEKLFFNNIGSGFYFVKIFTKETSITKKIIID